MYTSKIAISWKLSEGSSCSQTPLSPAGGRECPLLHHQPWAARGPITAWLSGDNYNFIDIIAPITQQTSWQQGHSGFGNLPCFQVYGISEMFFFSADFPGSMLKCCENTCFLERQKEGEAILLSFLFSSHFLITRLCGFVDLVQSGRITDPPVETICRPNQ